MTERAIDAGWIAAAAAAVGVEVAPQAAAELARTLERLLAALDALSAGRRFEDEPAGFLAVQQRHKQRERP